MEVRAPGPTSALSPRGPVVSVVRSPLVVMAVVLLLLAAGFRLDETGAHWLWADRPSVAVALALVGLQLAVVRLVRAPRRERHE